MRKCLVFIILILYLFVNCSTVEQLAMKDVFSIIKQSEEDIHGSYTIHRLILFKKITFDSNTVITIDKIHQTNTFYSITFWYIGPKWLFVDELVLNIDDIHSKLNCEDPISSINKSSNVTVSETAIFKLQQSLVNNILKAKKLNIQIKDILLKLSENDIKKIVNFLEIF